MKKKQRKWHEFLWISSSLYLILGFFNILFAWLGMICFLIPIILSFTTKSKIYCNKYCGRSQLFNILGNKFKLSKKKDVPSFLYSKAFRYGFLIFFLSMFSLMVYRTYLVFLSVNSLRETVKLLWSFKINWSFASAGEIVPSWIAQFAFGFYSLMLTSNILGFLTLVFYKPRGWCLYCPIGTMTQGICILQNKVSTK